LITGTRDGNEVTWLLRMTEMNIPGFRKKTIKFGNITVKEVLGTYVKLDV
jgi:hypothetical protein